MASAADRAALDALIDETRRIWDQKAEFWDGYFGEGNDFHKTLVEPATDRLLAPQPGEAVLDLACGNGAYARHLAGMGVRVVAADVSAVFIERARVRSVAYADRIEYRIVDATSTEQLLSLGPGQYDAAVATMALMDIPTIEPLAAALRQLLKPGGRFVFAVMHPCFNSPGAAMLAELDDRDGRMEVVHALKVTRYLEVPPEKGAGIRGEPAPHYYFHRPLSELFGVFFRHGLVLDGMEEPAFPADRAARVLSWDQYAQVPPVLAARLRVPGPPPISLPG